MAMQSGATVLMLHGFTHTGASWAPVRAALGERYRAITPDIRGHGSASGREPAALGAVLSDLSSLAPERFVLVGYSMGGRIALHLALALGQRVERLVLIGASPGIANAGEREKRRESDRQLADEIEAMSIEALAARWAQTPVLADQPAAVRALADEDRRRNQPAGLARALRGLGTGALPSLWDRLDELAMPVRLVVGERDQKFRAIAEKMARRVSDARVVVVPDAGHAVHLEAPESVAEVISTPS